MENMRALLEFLGIVEPDPTRREPVALPAWSRSLLGLALPALVLISALVLLTLRVVLG